jgi:ElaA protein
VFEPAGHPAGPLVSDGQMTEPPAQPRLFSATPSSLDVTTAYQILKLRVAVFVVEQHCPYPELDGRDLEADARWVWASVDGQVVGTLRVLFDQPDTARIGRVATAPAARSGGLGARLMRYALDELDRSPALRSVLLDAQCYLEGWYARFGFVRAGEDFTEDGIAHLPMSRPAQTGTANSDRDG